jgi:two-component system response regulator YesN
MSYKYIVVEDEPLIRGNLIKKIGALGLPFEKAGEAGDGETALEIIKKSPPELVITDIRMPVMDGIKLVQNLYENYPGIYSVILSGYNDFEYAQQAIRFGVKAFLLKPIKPEELKSTMQKILISLDSEHESAKSLINAQGLPPEELNRLLISYIRSNFRAILSMGQIADQFGFSEEYLSKVFKRYNETTPMKYITRLRIEEAKHLLILEPDMEIKQVGELVGYPDAFYFSRVFKACTGLYPKEYRTQSVQK